MRKAAVYCEEFLSPSRARFFDVRFKDWGSSAQLELFSF